MFIKIAITGSTGLIGSRVIEYFTAQGASITPIIRSTTPLKTSQRVIRWDIDSSVIDQDTLEGHDVVIHLAGANIAGRRWTTEYKRTIEKSRLNGTLLLANTIAQLKRPPKVFLSASAVGFYGKGDSVSFDEESPKGKGFLADVCRSWEVSAQPALANGVRVLNMRFGVVLAKKGGALEKMLPVFRLGLGGKIASGTQYLSWIALDEIPLIMEHLINSGHLSGPVNCVSPQSVTNEEFTQTLGRILKRPVVLPVPAIALKFTMGQMAQELLIDGAKVAPRRLLESGYCFKYPSLEQTIRSLLQ